MFIYTSIMYPAQSFYATLRAGGNFLHLFWVPTFLTIYYYDGGVRKTLNIVNKICFIWYCLILVQFVVSFPAFRLEAYPSQRAPLDR